DDAARAGRSRLTDRRQRRAGGRTRSRTARTTRNTAGEVADVFVNLATVGASGDVVERSGVDRGQRSGARDDRRERGGHGRDPFVRVGCWLRFALGAARMPPSAASEIANLCEGPATPRDTRDRQSVARDSRRANYR